MQQLLSSIASTAGISPEAAAEGVRVVLGFLSARSDGAAFAQFLDAVPGAREVLATEPSAAEGYGGPAMFAGMRLLKNLRETSIPAESLLPFARAVFSSLEAAAGSDLWTRVLGENQKLLAMVMR